MVTLVLALAAIGCSVPEVSFYDDAATGDSAGPVLDAGDADAGDSGALDGATVSDAIAEALDQGSCADGVLADGSVCCGAVVCSGDCAGQCPTCESRCNSAQLCCVKNQSVTCHTPAGGCP